MPKLDVTLRHWMFVCIHSLAGVEVRHGVIDPLKAVRSKVSTLGQSSTITMIEVQKLIIGRPLHTLQDHHKMSLYLKERNLTLVYSFRLPGRRRRCYKKGPSLSVYASQMRETKCRGNKRPPHAGLD
eukprot:scaffold23747_cov27-Prasinocladus_malaysianus.AAC.1